MSRSEYFLIGKVTRPHGLKGSVTISLRSEAPDLTSLDVVYLGQSGSFVPYFVDSVSSRGTRAYVKFQDFNTHEDAASISGLDVFLPIAARPAPGDGGKWVKVLNTGTDISAPIPRKSIRRPPFTSVVEWSASGLLSSFFFNRKPSTSTGTRRQTRLAESKAAESKARKDAETKVKEARAEAIRKKSIVPEEEAAPAENAGEGQ